MKIEKIEEKDLKEIQKIIETEFPYTKEILQPINERIKKPNHFLFKTIQEKKTTGFMELRILHGMGEILGIAVKKEFRRKGIAKEMIKFALNFFKEKNCFAIKLLVKKKNKAAIKLYIKTGFKTIRTSEQKISGEEANEMMQDLTEPVTPQIM